MALKAKPKFEYQARSADQWRKKAAEKGGDFDSIWKQGIKLFKPREGKNLIRILPPGWTDPPPDHYALDIYVNYGIGIDEQAYLSLSKMKHEPDPIAEARKQAEREG